MCMYAFMLTNQVSPEFYFKSILIFNLLVLLFCDHPSQLHTFPSFP